VLEAGFLNSPTVPNFRPQFPAVTTETNVAARVAMAAAFGTTLSAALTGASAKKMEEGGSRKSGT
jgi:hypothetical protein